MAIRAVNVIKLPNRSTGPFAQWKVADPHEHDASLFHRMLLNENSTDDVQIVAGLTGKGLVLGTITNKDGTVEDFVTWKVDTPDWLTNSGSKLWLAMERNLALKYRAQPLSFREYAYLINGKT